MEKLDLTFNNYLPNIRILANHIITFNRYCIYLYDKNAKLLDMKNSTKNDILDIFLIKKNVFLVYTSTDSIKMKVYNNSLFVQDFVKFNENKKIITCIEYCKKNKFLMISYLDNITILDINNLNGKPIQVINKKMTYFSFIKNLLIWNRNIFMIFNKDFIFIYKYSCVIKKYQLVTSIFIPFTMSLLKLNENILIVLTIDKLLSIDIRNIEIKNIVLPIENTFINKDLYKIKDNLFFIYNGNNLHLIKYYHNSFQVIQSIKKNDEIKIINYLSNYTLKIKFPHLKKRFVINCIENDKSKYNRFLIFGNKNRKYCCCGCAKLFLIEFSLLENIKSAPKKKRKKNMDFKLLNSFNKKQMHFKKIKNLNISNKYKKKYR